MPRAYNSQQALILALMWLFTGLLRTLYCMVMPHVAERFGYVDST